MNIRNQLRTDLQKFINENISNGMPKEKAVISCWIESSRLLTQITREMNVSLKKVTAALLFLTK